MTNDGKIAMRVFFNEDGTRRTLDTQEFAAEERKLRQKQQKKLERLGFGIGVLGALGCFGMMTLAAAATIAVLWKAITWGFGL